MRKHSTSILLLILIFIFTFSFAVSQAESYEASTMRLLRHSGAVEIFDASGAPRFLLDNVRFASGESIKTGEDGTASVSLDDSKILTMDVNSLVQFLQEAGHMQLNLLDGSLFLDVQKKLDENESFDIQTTTMTVGIRGTLVFASSIPQEAPDAKPSTVIGILEGTGRISYTDSSGAKRVFDLPAGQKVTIPDQPGAAQPAGPEVSSITAVDLPAYITQTVLADETLTNRVTEGSPDGAALLLGTATDTEDQAEEPFPAAGDWTWTEKVTLVAQSASKLYDGVPLSRTSDALVYGLPGNFHVNVSCTGSITNAGTADNTVSSYSIYNGSGENVTGHFTDIETIKGSLVVDPAPLVVWTGSAEKLYDGEPLVCPDAGIRTVPGHTAEDPAWKNSSLVTQTAAGSEKMVAVSGRTYVQGTNPLTGDTEKIELKAGQSLSVNLHDNNGKQGINFEIKDLTVDDIPDDVLRLYADNPELLEQACLDTNWDRDAVKARIAGLKPADSATAVTGTGLTVAADAKDNVMTDSTNVRIHIDSGITNYATRPLTEEEASFTPITLDPSIVITATGTQTEVGESMNTYTIDWGNAKSSNYTLREDLGTLTVTEALSAVTITAGSASKDYDGTALRANRYEAEGLPAGCTVTASVSGSVTDVGSVRNNITSYKILNAEGEDITDQCTVTTVSGRLTVRPASLTVTTGSAQKVYDGDPLTCDDVSVSGLASGESVTVTASGSITDPGSAENTCSISWDNASESNYTVSVSTGTLTVDPLKVEINCGGSSQEYTGELAVPEPSLTYRNGPHDEETVYGTRVTMMSGALHGASHRAAGDIRYTFSLFTGDVVSLTISGLSADVGTHQLSCSVSSTLPGLSWSVSGDTVTIQPIDIEIDCGGGTFTFADSVNITLSCNGAPYEFGSLEEDTCETEFELPNGDVLYLTVSGYPVDTMSTGTWMLTKSVSFETGKASDYNITYTNDKITIGPRTVYISKPDETHVYNGYPGPETTDIIVSNDPLNLVDASVGGDTYYAVDAGVYPMEAYTWVEYEYEPCIEFDTSGMGTLTILPAEVTLTSASDTKTYDTEPLTAEEVTVSGDGFAYGEGAEYTFTGSQTDAGSSSNTFTFTLNEDTKASNYKISTEFGTLTVDKAPLTVSTPVKSKTYDGEPLYIQEPDITITGIQGFEGIGVSLSDNVITKGGTSITPKLTVDWSAANKDNYDLTLDPGTLTVNKAPLTVTTGSAQKRYDGTPLKTAANDYEIDGIIYGADVVNIILTGSQTEEGASNNTFIVDEATSVNADCYEITPVFGTLTVAPRIQITLNLGGRTIQANPGGQPVDFDRLAVTATDSHGEDVPLTLNSAVVGRAVYNGTLPTGGSFSLTVTGSGIEPGTYDINCTVDSASEDFSDYEFVPTNNILTVIPAEPATTDGV